MIQIEWDKFPDHAKVNYISMDRNGNWYGWSTKPTIHLEEGYWCNDIESWQMGDFPFYEPNKYINLDWTKTLCKRP